jgi:hypothetical protein
MKQDLWFYAISDSLLPEGRKLFPARELRVGILKTFLKFFRILLILASWGLCDCFNLNLKYKSQKY